MVSNLSVNTTCARRVQKVNMKFEYHAVLLHLFHEINDVLRSSITTLTPGIRWALHSSYEQKFVWPLFEKTHIRVKLRL